MVCVKFGLITEETDVEDLIGMVQTIGKQVEESSKVRYNYQASSEEEGGGN